MQLIGGAYFLLLGLSTLTLGSAASLQCTQDIAAYIAGITPLAPKGWALQMLDSSSKLPPDGLMEGSFLFQFGNYDECLAAKGPNNDQGEPRFRGKYCRVQLGFKYNNKTDAKTELILAQMKIAYEQMSQKSDYPGAKHLISSLQPQAGLFPEGGGGIPAQWAVCAPSSCSADGVKRVADFNLGIFFSALKLDVSTKVIESSCYYTDDGSKDFTTGGLIFMVFFICLCTVMVFSAIIDYAWPKEKELHVVVKAFSLRSNLKELFTLPKKAFPGQLTCLNGIRVISTWWVILLHCYMVNSWLPHINAVTALRTYPKMWSMAPILSGGLSVDTFFLLSGLLTAYIPLIDQKKGRSFNVIKYYIYRYLRITLPLAMVVFYLAAGVHDISGAGPNWDLLIAPQTVACEKNWWATLTYINNYYKPVETTCVRQAWYLMVDMQLALLAPLILFPLLKWPKFGLGLTGVLTLGSMAYAFANTYIYHLPWTITFFQLEMEATGNFYALIYSHTPVRAMPYLFGVLLAYVLANRITFKMPKWLVIMEWLLNSAICLAVIYTIAVTYADDYDYEPLGAAFYAAFHRLGWSVGISWVIWACVNGYGGPVNSILSWKYFVPLSKLSFCAYLVHMDLMYFHAAMTRTNTYFSNFEIIFEFLGNLIMMIPFTLFLYLGVDAPAQVIIRAAFGKPNRAAQKEKPEKVEDQETEKPSSGIVKEIVEEIEKRLEDLEEVKSHEAAP